MKPLLPGQLANRRAEAARRAWERASHVEGIRAFGVVLRGRDCPTCREEREERERRRRRR